LAQKIKSTQKIDGLKKLGYKKQRVWIWVNVENK